MRLQAPKGTRDFFPGDMAWRQHLLDAWRRVSVRHGFEQVDGPIYESLDLYKVKSGEGIVSELFHFEDRGGREMAIRAEFTPTLARMVAEKANALPRPIKWFAMPNVIRAERPQRGRHRVVGRVLGPPRSPVADAEVILVAVDLLRELGLTQDQVKVKLSHREVVRTILLKLGVPEARILDAFGLLDRRDKMSPEDFTRAAGELGLDQAKVDRFEQMCRRKYPAGDLEHLRRSVGLDDPLDDFAALDEQLAAFGLTEWCEYDLGIVRGLAYYTGTVFEFHETSGGMRALAGGGRYDKLIEMFGGPPTPAVGLGMGDVVLSLVLQDKGLMPDNVAPTPDVFVFAASDEGAKHIAPLVASLRVADIHARFSYKTTRNVGKLLKDAVSCGARFAVILGDDAAGGQAEIKELSTGEQSGIALDQIAAKVKG